MACRFERISVALGKYHQSKSAGRQWSCLIGREIEESWDLHTSHAGICNAGAFSASAQMQPSSCMSLLAASVRGPPSIHVSIALAAPKRCLHSPGVWPACLTRQRAVHAHTACSHAYLICQVVEQVMVAIVPSSIGLGGILRGNPLRKDPNTGVIQVLQNIGQASKRLTVQHDQDSLPAAGESKEGHKRPASGDSGQYLTW